MIFTKYQPEVLNRQFMFEEDSQENQGVSSVKSLFSKKENVSHRSRTHQKAKTAKQQDFLDEQENDHFEFLSKVSSKENFTNQNNQTVKTITPLNDTQDKRKNASSSIIQYFHLQRFINKISHRRRMNSKFNMFHFLAINDKASIFNLKYFRDNAPSFKPLSKQLNSLTLFDRLFSTLKVYLQFLKQKITHSILDKIPLFYPESHGKLIWDGLMILPRLYFLIAIPFDLTFEQPQFLFNRYRDFTISMFMLKIIDFFINLNTAFYKKGHVVVERGQIFLHSLGSHIFYLFTLSFFFFITSDNNNKSVHLGQNLFSLCLIFLTFHSGIQIMDFTRQIEETLNLSKQWNSLLKLIKLITALIYVLHLFSCIWYISGYYSNIKYGISWMDKYNLSVSDQTFHYMYSFYYSTVTMFTVGYGDIVPNTPIEVMVSIVFMMISSIQLFYSVNTVGNLIDTISSYEEEKRKKIQIISSYMQQKKISYQLQYKVRQYLNYYWNTQYKQTSSAEQEIIDQLSEQLREQLMIEANNLILNNCQLFKTFFSKESKNKLAKKIRSKVVKPENIIDFDQICQEQNAVFICFIEKGQIEQILESQIPSTKNESSVIQTFSPGVSIGTISFVKGVNMNKRFRSQGFTSIQILSRFDFIQTIKDFPEDYELFLFLQDQLKFGQNTKLHRILENPCYSCHETNHQTRDCPLLHYIPDKEFIIKKYLFPYVQKRNEHGNNKFFRRRVEKNFFFNSRLDQDMVDETAQIFQAENLEEIQFYDVGEDDRLLEIHQEKKMSFKALTSPIIRSQKMLEISDIHQDEEKSPNPITFYETKQLKSSVARKFKAQNNPAQFLFPIIEFEKLNHSLQRQHSQTPKKPQKENDEDHHQLLPEIFKSYGQDSQSKNKFSSIKQSPFFQLSKQQKQKVIPAERLKKAFRMVRILNSFKLQRQKSYPLYAINSSAGTQKFILDSIKTRHEHVKNISQRIILEKRQTLNQMDLTMLRLQMLMGYIIFEDFEVIKSYKIYFPQGNVYNILQDIEISDDTHGGAFQIEIQDSFKRLLNYLLFPFIYIEKYKLFRKKSQINKMETNTIVNPQRKSPTKQLFQSRKSRVRHWSEQTSQKHNLNQIIKF